MLLLETFSAQLKTKIIFLAKTIMRVVKKRNLRRVKFRDHPLLTSEYARIHINIYTVEFDVINRTIKSNSHTINHNIRNIRHP